MTAYDLVIKGGTVVTAAGHRALRRRRQGRPHRCAHRGPGDGRRSHRRHRQTGVARGRRQPRPHRRATVLRRQGCRRVRDRHDRGGLRRDHDGHPLRPSGPRMQPARGGPGLSRQGRGPGGDRLRLPHHLAGPDGSSSRPGDAGADRGRLHLLQGLHDLRRHCDQRRRDSQGPGVSQDPWRHRHGACRERPLHSPPGRQARRCRRHLARELSAHGAPAGRARGDPPGHHPGRNRRRADPAGPRLGRRSDGADSLGPESRPQGLRRDLSAVPVSHQRPHRSAGLGRRQVSLRTAAA